MLQEELVRNEIFECSKLISNFPSTALHLAALHGHAEAVDYLLHEDVEFLQDQLGLTPLDYAKRGKNLSIISKLETKVPSDLNGHSD